MKAKQTSLDAYKEIQAKGQVASQRDQILNLIKTVHPVKLSRQDISRLLCIPINAVCGRVNELIKMGCVFEKDTKKNEKTGKKNGVLWYGSYR